MIHFFENGHLIPNKETSQRLFRPGTVSLFIIYFLLLFIINHLTVLSQQKLLFDLLAFHNLYCVSLILLTCRVKGQINLSKRPFPEAFSELILINLLVAVEGSTGMCRFASNYAVLPKIEAQITTAVRTLPRFLMILSIIRTLHALLFLNKP
jgi:hypothetical protein